MELTRGKLNKIRRNLKMENVIVLFEVTVKEGKMEDYLKRAGILKEHLKIWNFTDNRRVGAPKRKKR